MIEDVGQAMPESENQSPPETIAELWAAMNNRFDAIDHRFDMVDEHFLRVEKDIKHLADTTDLRFRAAAELNAQRFNAIDANIADIKSGKRWVIATTIASTLSLATLIARGMGIW